MMLYPAETTHAELADTDWPAEADLILSALAAGRAGAPGAERGNRRSGSRTAQRIRAELRLFSDLPGSEPWMLFTRDINARGVGFLCQRRVPLGQSGRVVWFDSKGTLREQHCTVRRCREAVQGWFEGALAFD